MHLPRVVDLVHLIFVLKDDHFQGPLSIDLIFFGCLGHWLKTALVFCLFWLTGIEVQPVRFLFLITYPLQFYSIFAS